MCLAFALAIGIFAACASPGAEDWPRFRGPGGAGRAGGAQRYPTDLAAAEALLWKVPCPPGHSSPIALGERVFLTAHLDEPPRLLTLCHDAASGRELWRAAIEVPSFEPIYHHGPSSPTPASDGQRVFAVFGSFGIVAYDFRGAELWRAARPMRKNTFGSASSPIVAGGKLIVFSSAEEGALLEALEPATGKLLWERRTSGPASSWSTPTPWRAGEREALLVYEPFHLRAIALEDGAVLWSVPGLADEPVTLPQVRGDLVYATSYNLRTNREAIALPTFEALLAECDGDGDGAIDADEAKRNASILSRPDADGQGDHPLRMFWRLLDADRDGRIRADEWTRIHSWMEPWTHANGILALELGEGGSTPKLAWQHENGVPECPTPLLCGELLFAVRNGGVLTCLDAASGAPYFQERLAARGPYYASPVASADALYLASERGELSVLAAARELRLLSTRDLGEEIYATPALARGRLLVRSAEHLWAFAERR
jgi:outer membrane protein assembly factor BamB